MLVKEGRYRGFGFVDESEGFSNVEEIENFLSPMHHTYHTSQIIRSYFKKNPYKNVVQFENSQQIIGAIQASFRPRMPCEPVCLVQS